MKKILMAAAGVSLISMIAVGCSSSSSSSASNSGTSSGGGAANAQVVNVQAKNWQWTVDTTSVKAGQPVKIVAKATEGVHELSIQGTNVKLQLTPGQEQTATFTPDKPGDYKIVCTLPCGEGHGNMSTTIKAE